MIVCKKERQKEIEKKTERCKEHKKKERTITTHRTRTVNRRKKNITMVASEVIVRKLSNIKYIQQAEPSEGLHRMVVVMVVVVNGLYDNASAYIYRTCIVMLFIVMIFHRWKSVSLEKHSKFFKYSSLTVQENADKKIYIFPVYTKCVRS